MTNINHRKEINDEGSVVDFYKSLISDDVFNKKNNRFSFISSKPGRVEDVATEEQRIKNKGLQQDMSMKKATLWILFSFLGVETITIFVFALFQAINFRSFHLEEWSFKLLITATISQITIMLVIAVKHLFPHK